MAETQPREDAYQTILRECLFLYKEESFELRDPLVVEVLKALKTGDALEVPRDCNPLLQIASILPAALSEIPNSAEYTPSSAVRVVARAMKGRLSGRIADFHELSQQMALLKLENHEEAMQYVMLGYTCMYGKLLGFEEQERAFNAKEFLKAAAPIIQSDIRETSPRNVTGMEAHTCISPMSSFILYYSGFRYFERYMHNDTEKVLPNADRTIQSAENQAASKKETIKRRARKKTEKGKKSILDNSENNGDGQQDAGDISDREDDEDEDIVRPMFKRARRGVNPPVEVDDDDEYDNI